MICEYGYNSCGSGLDPVGGAVVEKDNEYMDWI